MSLQKTLELKFDIDKLERKLITLGIGLTILLLCLKADERQARDLEWAQMAWIAKRIEAFELTQTEIKP